MKYSVYCNIMFSPQHFMLYRGKSTTFVTVYCMLKKFLYLCTKTKTVIDGVDTMVYTIHNTVQHAWFLCGDSDYFWTV